MIYYKELIIVMEVELNFKFRKYRIYLCTFNRHMEERDKGFEIF